MSSLGFYGVGLCLGLIIGACCGFLACRIAARRDRARKGQV